MVINYFKTALKNFLAHKIFSLINVIGLSVGLACCFIIALYIRYELSYDEHYQNADRIYRIHMSFEMFDGSIRNSPSLPAPAAPLMRQDIPEIEQAARFSIRNISFAYNNFAANEPEIGFADPEFFQLFDFQWLAGEPSTALLDPSNIVLTQSLVSKYFGVEDPVGKVIQLDNNALLTVSGVIADLPGNTHLNFSAVASYELLTSENPIVGQYINFWGAITSQTYVMLDEGVEIGAVQAQLPDFARRNIPPDTFGGTEELTSFRLDEIYMNDPEGGSMVRIAVFTAIALCILFIAAINFMNLSTARSSWRALEVGLRKTMGADRRQLIIQFLGEALMMVLIAMLVALGLLELFLPIISTITGMELAINYLGDPLIMAGLLGFTVILGIAAGSYPAFYLSEFKPASVLKGELTKGSKGVVLRSTLVIIQFSISIALIVIASVVYMQMQFTRNLDWGFNKEQIIWLQLPGGNLFDFNTQWDALESQMLANPNIESISHSFSIPLLTEGQSSSYVKDEESTPVRMRTIPADPDFLRTYQIELLAGRYFIENLTTDRTPVYPQIEAGVVKGSVILNEQAVRDWGWSPEEAIGQQIGLEFGLGERRGTSWATVIGVVSNTITTVKRELAPQVYTVPESYWYSYPFGADISIRFSESDINQVLDHIDATWQAHFPDISINRQFVSDRVEAMFQQENELMQLFALSASLAVLIACFGLYGLAAFNAEYRIKEIGIRKVMGGSVWSIVMLLTNDFSKLVLIANVLAWPVAYIAMTRWLENFAYRIDLTPLIFIGSGLIALCIAWVTVGGTAAKAASQKPVLALRYE